MQLALPFEPLLILFQLQKAGYEAYIVGGAVRDVLSGQLTEQTDFDFTTNATPEQIQTVLVESFYENTFGTVSLIKEHLWQMVGLTLPEFTEPALTKTAEATIDLVQATKIHSSLQKKAVAASNSQQQQQTQQSWQNYEITTYRAEGRYTDHRRPDEVSWGKDIRDDLSRRDFTINAMAIQVQSQFLEEIFSTPLTLGQATTLIIVAAENYTLIDPYDGQKDLAEHLLRPVGDPATRFEEDALRMLRAIRFSVQLNFKMTDETFAAIAGLAESIRYVSWERIRDEFLKMLESNQPAEAIELLEETGLLHHLIPELREGRGIEQGGHHTTDVWRHSLDALASCPSVDPIVRFATLLHDVGKPRTLQYADEDPTFYNHEIIGAKIARYIGERFRLSKRDIQRIYTLVRHHMFHYQPQNTDASIRRFMRKVGLENINDILDLREGDRLGSGARKTSWRLEEMKQRMIEQLHQPFDVTDLTIDGTDIMEALQIKPGPVIGKLLHLLFEEVLEDPQKNNREYLLNRAKVLSPTL